MRFPSENIPADTMSAAEELRVLRERARNPFWIQHEWVLRGERKVISSAPMPSRKQAHQAFCEACDKPGTTHVFLFQHCLGRTLILEALTP